MLHCLFEYLHGMGTVFALACYLQVKHLQHKSFTVTTSAAKQQMASLTVDSKLKEVFEYFDTELRRLSADLDKHRASFDKVVGLTVGPSCLAACLDACERFAQKASDRVWQGLGEKVDELSAACESLSPRWTHHRGGPVLELARKATVAQSAWQSEAPTDLIQTEHTVGGHNIAALAEASCVRHLHWP